MTFLQGLLMNLVNFVLFDINFQYYIPINKIYPSDMLMLGWYDSSSLSSKSSTSSDMSILILKSKGLCYERCVRKIPIKYSWYKFRQWQFKNPNFKLEIQCTHSKGSKNDAEYFDPLAFLLKNVRITCKYKHNNSMTCHSIFKHHYTLELWGQMFWCSVNFGFVSWPFIRYYI